MSALDTFNAYFEAFEETYTDDNWDRVAPFFAPEVIYKNVEGNRLEGRAAAIEYLKTDLDALDRRFDSRAFDGTPDISLNGDDVTMVFTVRYQKEGAADLVISGREVATIRDGQIQHMKDHFDDTTLATFATWMERHGDLLA